MLASALALENNVNEPRCKQINKCFRIFSRASAEASKTRSFTYNLDVYCTCQDVYFEEDIEKDESETSEGELPYSRSVENAIANIPQLIVFD